MSQGVHIPRKFGDTQPHWDPKRDLGASGCTDPTWNLETHNCTVIQKEIWILQGKAWVYRTMRDPVRDLGNSQCLDLMEFWEHETTLGL